MVRAYAGNGSRYGASGAARKEVEVRFSALDLTLCVVLVAALAAAGWFYLRRARQSARYRAEWARAVAGLRDLDEELERVWAAELRRIRGYP